MSSFENQTNDETPQKKPFKIERTQRNNDKLICIELFVFINT